MSTIGLIDAYLNSEFVRPYVGWHDDHRQHDGTSAYMPALQQVRSEFMSLLAEIERRRLKSCLQLGLGPSKASHKVWRIVFEHVTTIDINACIHDDWQLPGLNTHDQEAVKYASTSAPYDFLFIDAGHSYNDVRDDFEYYGQKVRPGGLIAFHDALPRAKYPEIKVHEFIRALPVTVFGDEVGTAVMEVK